MMIDESSDTVADLYNKLFNTCDIPGKQRLANITAVF